MDTVSNPRRNEIRSVGEQAAEWLLVLQEAGPKDLEAFSAWILESPLHVAAFLRASTMDSLLSRVDPERRIPIERAMATPAVPPAPAVRRARVARPAWGAAVAALGVGAVGLAILGGWRPSFHPSAWQTYMTAVGEQRALELEDGSVVQLNAQSRLETRFTSHARELRLLEGEALFKVAHDATRPFRVHTTETVIQAVGTQFDVYQKSTQTTVAVIEGAVQITHERKAAASTDSSLQATTPAAAEPVRLAAGEQVQIAPTGQVSPRARADVARVNAWRQRRLVFADEPLTSIVDEFNRYNRSPKLRIDGVAAGERRYAAAFDADDPESLVTILAKDPALQVERRDGELVIRDRAAH